MTMSSQILCTRDKYGCSQVVFELVWNHVYWQRSQRLSVHSIRASRRCYRGVCLLPEKLAGVVVISAVS